MIVIYKITNRLNGKIYIGQTRQQIEKRFIQHSHSNSPLGQAMRDCGLENFTIEAIEECETQDKANERECFWISVLKCKSPLGYNRTSGGAGVPNPVRNFSSEDNKKDALRRQTIIPKSFLSETNSVKAITIKRYDKYTPIIQPEYPHFKIIYVFDGQCTQNIGFENFFLKRGDIIVTAPETFHTIEIFDDISTTMP